MWTEIAVRSPTLWTRWMSPGGATRRHANPSVAPTASECIRLPPHAAGRARGSHRLGPRRAAAPPLPVLRPSGPRRRRAHARRRGGGRRASPAQASRSGTGACVPPVDPSVERGFSSQAWRHSRRGGVRLSGLRRCGYPNSCACTGSRTAAGWKAPLHRDHSNRETAEVTTRAPLAIEATGLAKSFGDVRAVDGVDLAVRSGSVYGVLGPDIVHDAHAVRSLVSLTGQLASVDEDLTGRENLVLLGRLLGLKRPQAKSRAAELLEAFGLAESAGRLVKHYSGGMRRRLDIAASIVVTPELMFLDEPTTGLDPRSRNQVWDIIRAFVADGTTILLCTQYLEEADQLADGIAVIDHGRVIAEGTPAQLKASVGSGALHVRLLDPEQRPQAERVLSSELDSVHLEADPAALSCPCPDADRAAQAVAELARAGVRIAEFSLARPSLDEVFLALTGHPAEEQTSEEGVEKEQAAA